MGCGVVERHLEIAKPIKNCHKNEGNVQNYKEFLKSVVQIYHFLAWKSILDWELQNNTR